MKTAIIVIADPQSATEEAAARVSNALAFAEKGKRQGDRAKSRLLEPEALARRAGQTRSPCERPLQSVRDVVQGRLVRLCRRVRGHESRGSLRLAVGQRKPDPRNGSANVRRYLARAGIPSCFEPGTAAPNFECPRNILKSR